MCIEGDRINLILGNRRFIEYCKKNNRYEGNRRLCRHNLQHFLDVARIAYILNLEKGMNYNKDIVYAAALLHDIGRWRQYEEGVPHDISSAELARDILYDSGYSKDENELIINAVKCHRNEVAEDCSLNHSIYFGDKKSRNCFSCEASGECNREESKRNQGVVY